jgi:hypothetical protein
MLALALQKEKKTQKDGINTNVKSSGDQWWKYSYMKKMIMKRSTKGNNKKKFKCENQKK